MNRRSALAAVALLLLAAGCSTPQDTPTAPPAAEGVPLDEATLDASPKPLLKNSDELQADGRRRQACPDSISWKDADEYLGQSVTVYGPVKQADYRPDVNGEPTFISLGKDYPSPDRLAIIIFGDSLDAFDTPPAELVDGKTICVSGYVEDYRGTTQITVGTQQQIIVVD